MRLSLLLLSLISLFSYAQTATIGDFSSNQQADRIDNSSDTKVTQEGQVASTAVAPSSPVYSQDVCVFSGGAGVQTQVLGLAFGKSIKDVNCERLKLSKQLQSLGLKVGAVSLLCQDARVWWALYDSGTPCPTNQGLIGEKAYSFYRYRPDRVPKRPRVNGKRSKP